MRNKTGEECSSNGEKKLNNNLWPEKLNEIYNLEDLGADGRVILKLT